MAKGKNKAYDTIPYEEIEDKDNESILDHTVYDKSKKRKCLLRHSLKQFYMRKYLVI